VVGGGGGVGCRESRILLSMRQKNKGVIVIRYRMQNFALHPAEETEQAKKKQTKKILLVQSEILNLNFKL
jgi:ribonuclease PH